MFVVGFDFGTKQCTIAVAQKGGVDVIANEVSNRLTPSLVSFGEKERYIGEPAATNHLRNIRNTITNIKRFIGVKFADVQDELKSESFNAFELPNGQIGFNVQLCGESRQISAVATLGSLLGKLKRTTEAFAKAPLREVVVSVPVYWTEYQRRALLNAGTIAGLNITRLINESTATALSYGIYKDLPEDNPLKVMFIDIGDSSTTVSAIDFKKGQLQVKATACEKDVGGRNFDATLLKYWANEFKKNYKIDIYENKKALIRTQQACEKLKKMLSSNFEAPISIDSLMDDKDVKGMMNRDQFEALIQSDLEALLVPVKKVLEATGMTPDQFSSIEVTGGGTRSTSVQKKLVEFLGRDLSKTINSEESVCRGCALQCAMMSPVFKVRQFAVNEIASYPIQVQFKSASGDQNLQVFNNVSPVPSAKPIRFSFPITKAEPFQLLVTAPYGTLQTITVNNVPAFTNKTTVKARVWLDVHGIFHLDEVKMVETLPEEPEQPKEDKMDETQQHEEKKEEVKKVKVQETPLEYTVVIPYQDKAELMREVEEEGKMHAADCLASETADKKNALESYIYDMRSKLSGALKPFATEQESNNLMSLLTTAEDWLYGDGEDATKSVYVAKLDELQKIGNPIEKRRTDRENYPEAVDGLRQSTSFYKHEASSNAEKYEHIAQEDKDKIIAESDHLAQWVESLVAKEKSVPVTQNCTINIAEVNTKRQQFETMAKQILNKPKPAPPKPQTPPTPQPASTSTPDQPQPEKPTETQQPPAQDASMECD
ncbi:heat shock protein Hsp70 family protein [Heterostelium album PN500]|uniref:Heat shock protein Hsp70 family protein n=1 Tax=Heterostelium pallidum (strain ATCC 26659 / Pp 5 / PN500) TaxID=670386 RepID=D3AVW9_HETP5|nr:heat shock protein Hsp70 family protein [Heterostelium album PN500]EFA86442.1 heat shock protein Hsp70 family protein [Heterostelium album PN500]|eukprot:XP_020438547.1 heat shock protein Hsp70 family protein [Heterostelium album PN500]